MDPWRIYHKRHTLPLIYALATLFAMAGFGATLIAWLIEAIAEGRVW